MTGVGVGERVRLPERHDTILTDVRSDRANRPPRYTSDPVKSTLEALDGNKVRLSVEVDEAEFDRNIDAAFRKIATEVRLPGFRPGKAPRKVLEARIGLAAARAQAIQDAIPEYLSRAVREHDVDLIATPEVDLKEGEEDGIIKFDATCEVRPEISVPGYKGLRVELVNPSLSEEEMDDALQTELRRHGTLEDVDRPSESGDSVIIDMQATRGGEPVVGLNVDEWTYEIGRGWVAPGFDDQVTGVTKGDELRFVATPNGSDDPADFVVTINKVQTLKLPELNDDFVAESIAEADTVEEWRGKIRERHEEMRLNQMRRTVVDRVTDALADLVTIDPPEAMVSSDLQSRLQNTIQQFQQQGIALDQWLSVTGQDAESFIAGIKVQSEKAVKVDLALRAVATTEGIDVSDEELDAEFSAIGVRFNEKTDKVRKLYEKNDAVGELVAQMRKSKALDWLMHQATFVDQNGDALDTTVVLGDHEHDHDHDGESDQQEPVNSAEDTTASAVNSDEENEK